MVEIFIENGKIFIPRGSEEDNKIILDLFADIVGEEALKSFIHISDEREVLFGNSLLCG